MLNPVSGDSSQFLLSHAFERFLKTILGRFCFTASADAAMLYKKAAKSGKAGSIKHFITGNALNFQLIHEPAFHAAHLSWTSKMARNSAKYLYVLLIIVRRISQSHSV